MTRVGVTGHNSGLSILFEQFVFILLLYHHHFSLCYPHSPAYSLTPQASSRPFLRELFRYGFSEANNPPVPEQERTIPPPGQAYRQLRPPRKSGEFEQTWLKAFTTDKGQDPGQPPHRCQREKYHTVRQSFRWDGTISRLSEEGKDTPSGAFVRMYPLQGEDRILIAG